jgi:uncharacterized protein
MSGQADAVTVVVTRVVRPGKEEEFAAWAEEIDTTTRRFPGFLAAIRLHDDQGLNHLVYQFDTPAHLHQWEISEERRRLVERAEPLSEARHTSAGGRDNWFTVPGGKSTPRWKTFLITWAGVYPTLLIISTALKLALPSLPQPLALAVSSATLTAILTWVLLPRITRRARPWLLRDAQPRRTTKPSDNNA